jgi:eukaryotic-like serine/threonine-protein kinase
MSSSVHKDAYLEAVAVRCRALGLDGEQGAEETALHVLGEGAQEGAQRRIAEGVTLLSGAQPRVDISVDETILSGQQAHVTIAPIGALKASVKIKEALGLGGMGVVYRASQAVLDRDVAVKLPREGSAQHGATERLLREARTMGLLEHPNIVPVHWLGQDDAGRPMLVMKRVIGTSWRDLIADPAHPEMPDHDGDRLGFHLDVLAQVCRAVHFAHTRGVLHLDIKPENVMVGRYGEVYLVDWGISVGVDESLRGRLPMRDEVRILGGTPSYMAPEMAMQTEGPVSERSDVFLLGACLHHVITGKAPHQGKTVLQVMYAAATAASPQYDPGAPPELAAIATRAMARDPSARFASAEALRAALVASARHRSSNDLSEEAARRLEALRAQAGEGASPEVVRDLYTQCRFGCEQALRAWDENAQAIEVRRALLIEMVRYHLRGGALDAAQGLLDELDTPPAPLVEALEALRAQRAAEASELAFLRSEKDRGVSARVRVMYSSVMAVVAPLVLLALGQLRSSTEPAGFAGVAAVGAALAVTTLYYIRNRAMLTRNRLNSQYIHASLVVVLGLFLMRVDAFIRDVSYGRALADTLLALSLFGGLFAVAIDRCFTRAALLLGVGWAVTLASPAYAFEISALAYLLSFGSVALTWMHDMRHPSPSPQGSTQG